MSFNAEHFREVALQLASRGDDKPEQAIQRAEAYYRFLSAIDAPLSHLDTQHTHPEATPDPSLLASSFQSASVDQAV